MEQRGVRHDELTAAGWTRQSALSEPRLSEAVEAYEEIGFEVTLDAVDLCAGSEEGGCTACLGDNPEFVKVIYTRPADEDLD